MKPRWVDKNLSLPHLKQSDEDLKIWRFEDLEIDLMICKFEDLIIILKFSNFQIFKSSFYLQKGSRSLSYPFHWAIFASEENLKI